MRTAILVTVFLVCSAHLAVGQGGYPGFGQGGWHGGGGGWQNGGWKGGGYPSLGGSGPPAESPPTQEGSNFGESGWSSSPPTALTAGPPMPFDFSFGGGPPTGLPNFGGFAGGLNKKHHHDKKKQGSPFGRKMLRGA